MYESEKYDEIVEWLRENLPEESENEIGRLADIIYHCWLDDIV